MSDIIALLYIVYIIVIIISLIIIFWLIPNIDFVNAFLYASILAAIAVFIGSFWVDANNSTEDQVLTLSVLFIIVSLIPILCIFYIAFIKCTEICDICELK